MVLYGLVQGKTLQGKVILTILGVISLLGWALLKSLLIKMDRHNFREKFPVAVRNFLRRNPNIRVQLAMSVAIPLVIILLLNQIIGAVIGDSLLSLTSLTVLALLTLLLFILSTRLPDRTGKVIPFDDVKLLLLNAKLDDIYIHFEKAAKFYDEDPQPDIENCVKESVCALEAYILKHTGLRDFDEAVKKLTGKDTGKIPASIAQGITKLYAYRGDGKGIAHAALRGSNVTISEAELILNLVASYIIYLNSLFSPSENSGVSAHQRHAADSATPSGNRA